MSQKLAFHRILALPEQTGHSEYLASFTKNSPDQYDAAMRMNDLQLWPTGTPPTGTVPAREARHKGDILCVRLPLTLQSTEGRSQ